MDSLQLLHDVIQRPLDDAERVGAQLPPALLNAHPWHDNSPAWLLWHAARQLDEQLSELSGEPTVWLAGGFAERFGLDVAPHDLGFGHSGEQARAVVVSDVPLLVDHLRAVIEAQHAYVDALDESDLDVIVDDSWDPPVTRAARLVSMSLDAAAHIAQVEYVLGMGSRAFEEDHG